MFEDTKIRLILERKFYSCLISVKLLALGEKKNDNTVEEVLKNRIKLKKVIMFNPNDIGPRISIRT